MKAIETKEEAEIYISKIACQVLDTKWWKFFKRRQLYKLMSDMAELWNINLNS